jgi:hypothetical protein
VRRSRDAAGVIQLIPTSCACAARVRCWRRSTGRRAAGPGEATQHGWPRTAWLALPAVLFADPDLVNQPPRVVPYDNALIRRFAEQFGRPEFTGTGADGQVTEIAVVRDSACGCAHFVARGLAGCALGEAEHQAGMLHHHYPCLASMNQDADYHDTLMHVSGNIVREAVVTALRPYLEPTPYFRPHGRVDDAAEGTTNAG